MRWDSVRYLPRTIAILRMQLDEFKRFSKDPESSRLRGHANLAREKDGLPAIDYDEWFLRRYLSLTALEAKLEKYQLETKLEEYQCAGSDAVFFSAQQSIKEIAPCQTRRPSTSL